MKYKQFDCVATMREIREELSEKYQDSDEEEKFLKGVRERYRM